MRGAHWLDIGRWQEAPGAGRTRGPGPLGPAPWCPHKPCCAQGHGQGPHGPRPTLWGRRQDPAPRSLVHADLPVGLAGNVVEGQAASVVLGVGPAQHQLAPRLGFRIPAGEEEAVRRPAHLCARHPDCG